MSERCLIQILPRENLRAGLMQVCLPLFPSATVCICDTICEFFVHVTQLTQYLKTLAVRTHASGGLRVWSADVRLTFAPTVPQPTFLVYVAFE